MSFILPASPSSELLSAAFGFSVPGEFIRLLELLYTLGGDSHGADALFHTLTRVDLYGSESRYPQTPPELFPIVTTGGDGEHYGYIIHLPQQAASDYPVGLLGPMDGDGVFLIGDNTRNAIENILSTMHKDIGEISQGDSAAITQFCTEYGISPCDTKAKLDYLEVHTNGKRVVPTIPAGWRFISSMDGIGVLAPTEAFQSGPHAYSELADFNVGLAKGVDALREGYPATALYYLREAYWDRWTDTAFAHEVSRQLSNTYEALERPLLAREVERRRALLVE